MPANTPRKIEAVQNTCRIIDVLWERDGAGVTEILGPGGSVSRSP